MNKLWRSFPPIYLLLWLSKWLRHWKIQHADNYVVMDADSGDLRALQKRMDKDMARFLAQQKRIKPTKGYWPKPLKGESKKSKPAPKVEVRVSSKHRNTDLGKALEAWARGDLDFIETSQERKPFKEEK